MKSKLNLAIAGCLLLVANNMLGQFNVTGQYMGRGEYRHGYQTLADTNQKGTGFVSQRARIGAEYKAPKYTLVVNAQDIRVWGSDAGLAPDTKGFFSIFEAYGEVFIKPTFSIKAGRQTIAYDDDRIFGSLDWAMQARRHDAMLLKYRGKEWSADLGLAYNQNAESNKFIQYTNPNYKCMQHLWINHKKKDYNISALFLNTGYTSSRMNVTTNKLDTFIANMQTMGLRGEVKSGKQLTFSGYAYYQYGKTQLNKDIGAYDLNLEIRYKPLDILDMSLGAEWISGTSQVDTVHKMNRSFNPLFGTNHRFNGYMDYFYVGNHINTVGLNDNYFNIHINKDRFLGGLGVHYFNAAADIRDKTKGVTDALPSRYLGTELDFTLCYQIADGVALQSGYSHYLGSEGLRALRGVSSLTPISNWAYAMLLIRPGGAKFPKSGLKF